MKKTATSTAFGNDRVITVVTPNGTNQVEITGIQATPEFGSLAGFVSAISIICVVLVSRKFHFQK
ncbi:MAG: PEFG-CTERM sorting domain-containing protein [Thaumarchaeota archaeon]|nr:PEFG-CTERM sorting domain-containing protein [Nitrososphaerota archaeon]